LQRSQHCETRRKPAWYGLASNLAWKNSRNVNPLLTRIKIGGTIFFILFNHFATFLFFLPPLLLLSNTVCKYGGGGGDDKDRKEKWSFVALHFLQMSNNADPVAGAGAQVNANNTSHPFAISVLRNSNPFFSL
jgi:hypothetical protein